MKTSLWCAALAMTLFSASWAAGVELASVPLSTDPTPIETYTALMPTMAGIEGIQLYSPVVDQTPLSTSSTGQAITYSSGSAGLTINIIAGTALQSNAPALAAWQRAATQWTSLISTPITVTINADMADLGSGGIIGGASSVTLQSSYNNIRNPLVANAAAQGGTVAIVAAVPTAAQFSAMLPNNFSLSGKLSATKANLKAIGGFGNLDGQFGASDATINFNTQFSFDYDNSNGVTGGQIDFESVAAHEIGHVLGFVSSVDDIDYYMQYSPTISYTINPMVLDLFRFNATTNNPASVSNFTAFPRNLIPGAADNTDQILAPVATPLGNVNTAEMGMSTGEYKGDGRQSSHWKDRYATGNYIGIMNPTISYGTIAPMTAADLRAMELIGYDLTPVPEPGTLALAIVGLVGAGLFVMRRKILA